MINWVTSPIQYVQFTPSAECAEVRGDSNLTLSFTGMYNERKEGKKGRRNLLLLSGKKHTGTIKKKQT